MWKGSKDQKTYYLRRLVHFCPALDFDSEVAIQSAHFSLQLCNPKLIFLATLLQMKIIVPILVACKVQLVGLYVWRLTRVPLFISVSNSSNPWTIEASFSLVVGPRGISAIVSAEIWSKISEQAVRFERWLQTLDDIETVNWNGGKTSLFVH